MTANSRQDETVPDLEAELRRLRKRLADAWWNEEPLERIEQLEAGISRCQARLPREA